VRYDVVTIVASRRGISQLRDLLSKLPYDFGTPIVCLVEADPRLALDLAEATRLVVQWAQPGSPLEAGNVYLSPPDTSILMLGTREMSLAPFGAESTALHPVDTFLRSTAKAYADRALAVMLGAFPDDGGDGARALKAAGATMLVLDRTTSEYLGLADAIVRNGSYHRILSAGEVANALRMSFTGRDLLANAELLIGLDTLLDSTLKITRTRIGDVQLLEAAKDRLHIVAHRGLPRAYLDHFDTLTCDDSSVCGRAVRSGRRIVVSDLFDDDGYAIHQAIARETGYRAEQATPFFSKQSAAGAFSTLYREVHALSREEAEGLDAIGDAASRLMSGASA